MKNFIKIVLFVVFFGVLPTQYPPSVYVVYPVGFLLVFYLVYAIHQQGCQSNEDD